MSLDDDHLRPEWDGDRRADITVRQLLQMTSGLAWDETYALDTPITRMLYLEHDMGAYVASQGLAHDPGTHPQYSSGSTTLLCSMLADAHRPRREPPPRPALRATRPEQRGARAGRGRHAGVQLVHVGHAARLGGRRPVRARRRRVERAAPAARRLAGGVDEGSRGERRSPPRTRRAGGPTRGRTARSSSPGCPPTPTSPRATTGSGRSWCRPSAWSWSGSASPPRARTAAGSRPPSGCCARCGDRRVCALRAKMTI